MVRELFTVDQLLSSSFSHAVFFGWSRGSIGQTWSAANLLDPRRWSWHRYPGQANSQASQRCLVRFRHITQPHHLTYAEFQTTPHWVTLTLLIGIAHQFLIIGFLNLSTKIINQQEFSLSFQLLLLIIDFNY